jgi:hypothetical protein
MFVQLMNTSLINNAQELSKPKKFTVIMEKNMLLEDGCVLGC